MDRAFGWTREKGRPIWQWSAYVKSRLIHPNLNPRPNLDCQGKPWDVLLQKLICLYSLSNSCTCLYCPSSNSVFLAFPASHHLYTSSSGFSQPAPARMGRIGGHSEASITLSLCAVSRCYLKRMAALRKAGRSVFQHTWTSRGMEGAVASYCKGRQILAPRRQQ